jgi:cation:H+ antiporter
MIFNLVVFIVACLILVKSASWLVSSLTKIAEYFRMSEFVIGFIIMALATSVPELFVGVTSALEGSPLLGVGTVIGSNIVDLTLVIGVAVILGRGIKLREKTIRRDIFYMMLITLLPIILMLLGNGLSRLDGVILLLFFLAYMWRVFKQKRRFKKYINSITREEALLNAVFFFISLTFLFFSAELVVRFGTLMASDVGLPPILIGLFAIAIGTSLPELSFEVRGVLAKHEEMVMGDIVGSVVMNTTLVLGVLAVLSKETIILENPLIFFSSAIFAAITAFIFMTFAESERGFSWNEGVSLILLYAFFMIIEFYIKTIGGS